MADFELRCFAPWQDTAKVLAISRIMVAWQPVGIAAGVFDMCVRYTGERQQFGAALGAFQLVQERLARMLGNVQAMFLMCWRLSKLYEQVSMVLLIGYIVRAKMLHLPGSSIIQILSLSKASAIAKFLANRQCWAEGGADL